MARLGSFIFEKRLKSLTEHLLKFLPPDTSLQGLDVGCGSGELAVSVQRRRPNITIEGVDVLLREGQLPIKIAKFNGKTLPFPDKSFDFVMIVDVIHHTQNQLMLLKECQRVARQFILIKDHICGSSWDRLRLKVMDWVGNRVYNVALPYSYLSRQGWLLLYRDLGIEGSIIPIQLNCYPWPFSYVFDSTLHFISKLPL